MTEHLLSSGTVPLAIQASTDHAAKPPVDGAVTQLARQLMEAGLEGLSERERRVILHIAKRQHVARDVNSVLVERQTFGERLADRVAQMGGSWGFILVFTGMLVAWVVVNTVVLARAGAFDPYPYIFLNLILSMVAALQAPVILMSQNRQAARDRLAAGLDYEINLKAEVEIMALHDKLDRIRMERLEGMLAEQSTQIEAIGRAVDADAAKPTPP
ncbi:DUF1003 domain-containing protein [Methylobacterium sp. J-072]|uniref:DUF1003 domain-containing protein n=1 Tax=Methylobacterium sp. J-072 TaxID=2836651 RepID=UPI001FBA2210|nr:DUF1003 domain-containing protein [Methylobacterium sp. J-072]MCJ2095139.1 DUF1003 domain-containing protein [Methylobacterium sp. J-072]